MNPRDVEEIYELSPLQNGMLFHTLFEPESKLYFEQIVVPIESAMDAQACEQAWNHVAEDNTALRTSFHWQQIEKPVQVVHRKVRVPFAAADLHGLTEERRVAELRKLLEEDRRLGFDLSKAPLLRVNLLQWSSGNHRLILSFHHIIMDGWSIQHVFRQFSDAYQALCLGAAPLHRRGRPYSDYIRWLQKRDRDAAQAYWKKTLGDLEGPCLLPPDADASGDATTFAEHELLLPAETMARVRELSARQKLTLNTILQGAWALMLAHVTGREDVVFGVTASGRPAELPDVESMIGLFINTVPLRTAVRRDATVADWLRRLQQEQFEARQFDHSPLVQIREAGGFAGRGEMFDTLFAFENYPAVVSAHGEGPSASLIERTNYALSAIIVPRDELEVRLLYRTNLLSAAGARRISERYARIVESFAEFADATIGELPLMTDADRALFHALNDTSTSYPSEATVTELVEASAATWPDAIALEHGDTTMTYAELDARANALAAELRASGVGHGDNVALLFERSFDAVVSMFAVLKCGAAYVPIDTAFPPARINAILEDTNARAVLPRNASVPPADQAASRRLTTDDPAYIMYTSGSTGTPKGVVVPHRAIVRLIRNTNYIDITPSDRVANISNGAFDASTFEIWGALANGARLVIFDRDTVLSPRAFANEIRKRQAGVFFVTSALFNQIVDEVPDAFATARMVMVGGHAVDPRAIRAVLEAGPPRTLANGYGPTESTTFAAVHLIREVPAGATSIPIGRPISNTTTYVLDPRMQPVPPGGTGELWIGGDGLAHGYHRRPDLTAERFLPDPFSGRSGARMYRTGDKVRWRADGTIDFLGRLDHQLKLRGYRIELAEIEHRLLAHPAVAQAIVVARDDGGGTRIVAYVVARADAPSSWTRDLRQSLRGQLPDYMQPALEPLDALPLNSNGKVDRDALPPPAHEQESEEPFVAPRTETERRLALLWQQLLGRDRIGVHDVFFHLGGHSILATQLVSRVRRELGVELPLRDVFEHPTIAALARRLDAGAAADTPEIIRVSRDKHRVAPRGA